jgi:hypothetical protein
MCEDDVVAEVLREHKRIDPKFLDYVSCNQFHALRVLARQTDVYDFHGLVAAECPHAQERTRMHAPRLCVTSLTRCCMRRYLSLRCCRRRSAWPITWWFSINFWKRTTSSLMALRILTLSRC